MARPLGATLLGQWRGMRPKIEGKRGLSLGR
jgi:hypothetical protein